MAHHIFFDEQKKEHAFFSVQQKPWHGLGKIITGYPTSAEAIRYAGLDYEVIKQGIYTRATHGQGEATAPEEKEVPDYFATLRKDNNTVLGIVGKDYEVVQNRDAFSFFDSIVGGDGILYETAGALGNGERIFITAKLPGYIKVGHDDLIEQYLFLTTSHDGSGSITAAFTPVRIVCANTLNAALKNNSHALRIKHTANAKERLEQAHRIMGIADTLGSALEETFNRWSKIPVSDAGLKTLIESAMAPNKETLLRLDEYRRDELSTVFKKTCEEVYEYAVTDDSQLWQTTKGTVFGAYNAITGYYQNVRKWNSGEAKLKSVLLGGTAQQRAQNAFNLCSSLAAS